MRGQELGFCPSLVENGDWKMKNGGVDGAKHQVEQDCSRLGINLHPMSWNPFKI